MIGSQKLIAFFRENNVIMKIMIIYVRGARSQDFISVGAASKASMEVDMRE